MPTATPFTALGRGNGFPFCLNRLTVSELKTEIFPSAPSGSVVHYRVMSLVQLAKLYWNTFAVIGSASAVETNISASINGQIETTIEPFKRVCNPSITFPPLTDSDTDQQSDEEFFNTGSVSLFASFGSAFFWIELYDTDKTDPSDFLGYVWAGRFQAFAAIGSNFDPAFTSKRVEVSSVVLDETGVSSYDSYSFSKDDVTIGGIPLIKATTLADDEVGYYPNASLDADISDIEFYTYA